MSPSNETVLVLSSIEDLRAEGRIRDAKLDRMLEVLPGLGARVGELETKVGRHQWGGIVALLLIVAGVFGEGAKNAVMQLLGMR